MVYFPWFDDPPSLDWFCVFCGYRRDRLGGVHFHAKRRNRESCGSRVFESEILLSVTRILCAMAVRTPTLFSMLCHVLQLHY